LYYLLPFHANQPSYHLLYLFTCAGKPHITQKWVRKTMDELYHHDINSISGDEDNGEISAWYILNSIGIYSFCTGHPSYIFDPPLFKKATIYFEDGKGLTIHAPEYKTENVYVKSIRQNDNLIENLWISHKDFVNGGGGNLTFEMSNEPTTKKTYNKSQLPFLFLPHE